MAEGTAGDRTGPAAPRRRTEAVRRQTARLLRYLAGGPARVDRHGALAGGMDGEGGEGGEAHPGKPDAALQLVRDDAAARRVEARLVATLVSAGLVLRQHDRLHLAEPGRLWLKRALAGGDDAFQAQHRHTVRTTIDDDGRRTTVTVNRSESPLAGLARLKNRDGTPFLPGQCLEAGERLRADFTRAQMMPRITANWEASVAARGRHGGRGGMGELTDSALAARERVERALEAVGPELAGCLIDVCCFLKGLETVERERQWPVRSGKVLLRAGLGALARHYAPAPRRQRTGLRIWAGEGYRPELSGRPRRAP